MYKYRILELMRKLPREKEQIICNTLPVKLGVSEKTFKDWLYIKRGDKRNISALHLHHISEVLEVDFYELLNDRPKMITWEQLKTINKTQQQCSKHQ